MTYSLDPPPHAPHLGGHPALLDLLGAGTELEARYQLGPDWWVFSVAPEPRGWSAAGTATGRHRWWVRVTAEELVAAADPREHVARRLLERLAG